MGSTALLPFCFLLLFLGVPLRAAFSLQTLHAKQLRPGKSAPTLTRAPARFPLNHSLQEEAATTFIRPVFVACLLPGLLLPFAVAQEEDAEGGKDHPLISRHPGSYINPHLSKEFYGFTLITGE
jgi:hypothetical protein